MSDTVNMYTVVPVSLATDLKERKKVTSYNTLPQLNPAILDVVREFMTENVGFSDLPMACLSLNKRAEKMSSSELFHYLPANNRENVLFQLQMPDDMIVTVRYDELLEASTNANTYKDDQEELALITEDFRESLILGEGDYDDEEVISFIPFLAYDYCKFYAKFDENFGTSDLEIPGIEKFSFARLTAFID